MKKHGQSLDKIIERTSELKQIRKEEVHFGDLVVISTQNSVYSLRVLDNGFYLVSGGWFEQQGLSPHRIRIAGCTWGGSIIKIDIIAACGLCLEFSNRLITSPIKEFSVFPSGLQN